MLIRRESPSDISAIGAVHAEAFANQTHGRTGNRPPEVRLVDELRASPDWLERLSLVAVVDGLVVGHVCCTRGHLDEGLPALGLGPLGVLPGSQRRGVGKALVHAVLGAAMALDEPMVCLLGSPDYYRRFGFVPAAQLGVRAPDDSWGDHFQALALLHPASLGSGCFRYAKAFDHL